MKIYEYNLLDSIISPYSRYTNILRITNKLYLGYTNIYTIKKSIDIK